MSVRSIFPLFLFVVLAATMGAAVEARAGETVEVDAKLIWSTNHDQPPDESYTRVDENLTKELQRAFKWKNYFIINSKAVDAPTNKKVTVKMSDQCDIKIKYLGDDKFEVWLLGKDAKTGEMVALTKGTQKIGKDQKIMLMGVNDDQSGWVVKLCRPDK